MLLKHGTEPCVINSFPIYDNQCFLPNNDYGFFTIIVGQSENDVHVPVDVRQPVHAISWIHE